MKEERQQEVISKQEIRDLIRGEFKKQEGIIKKSLEYNEKMFEMTKKIKKYIFWQQIFNVLRIFIILIPIILGIIYLPPLLKQALKQYSEIIGPISGMNPLPTNEIMKIFGK